MSCKSLITHERVLENHNSAGIAKSCNVSPSTTTAGSLSRLIREDIKVFPCRDRSGLERLEIAAYTPEAESILASAAPEIINVLNRASRAGA